MSEPARCPPSHPGPPNIWTPGIRSDMHGSTIPAAVGTPPALGTSCPGAVWRMTPRTAFRWRAATGQTPVSYCHNPRLPYHQRPRKRAAGILHPPPRRTTVSVCRPGAGAERREADESHGSRRAGPPTHPAVPESCCPHLSFHGGDGFDTPRRGGHDERPDPTPDHRIGTPLIHSQEQALSALQEES